MSDARTIHCYEYVNRPYARVRDALLRDATGVFHRATTAATGRAGELLGALKMNIAGLEVGKNIVLDVKRADTSADAPGHIAGEATEIELGWRAETNAGLFPSMTARLRVYPLSADETQLDLEGAYEPPGGALGNAADRLVGHRVARATVHRFLRDLATKLSDELG